MKRIILVTSIVVASGVLFANLYTSIVDARSWGADLPHSIGAARAYFKVVNPGHFFRMVSPALQLASLVAVLVFWRSHPGLRRYLGTAFLLFVLTDGLTFGYFYPRNEMLFSTVPLNDVNTLRRVWQEWSTMNWLRSAMVLTGIVLSCVALHKTYAAGGSEQAVPAPRVGKMVEQEA